MPSTRAPCKNIERDILATVSAVSIGDRIEENVIDRLSKIGERGDVSI